MTGTTNLKVLITGAAGAGTTTLLMSLSEVSVLAGDQREDAVAAKPRVAVDFGRLAAGQGLAVFLFGVSLERRDELKPEVIADGLLGAVLVVDGRSPDGLDAAVRWLPRLRDFLDTPLVVAVNGVSEVDASAVRERLRLAPHVAVIGVDAREPEQARGVLSVLLHAVRSYVAGANEDGRLAGGST